MRYYTDEQLETLLFNYKYIKSETTEEGILNPFRLQDTNIGGGSSSYLSNPTESVVMQLLDDNTRAKKVCRAISITYAEMTPDKKHVMEVYFFDREYGKKDIDIACDLQTDRSNLWRWKKKILKVFRNVLESILNA